jgi:UDP-2-acetamido-2,6-beta-L-arabino-hexul-4-ose reductase
MNKIGITGGSGFIGWHLTNRIKLFPEDFELIHFSRSFFDEIALLDEFVSSCDVIFHLAGINRCENEDELYSVNIQLASKLRDSIIRTGSELHLIYASSTKESDDSPYGRSKKAARLILSECCRSTGFYFTSIISFC